MHNTRKTGKRVGLARDALKRIHWPYLSLKIEPFTYSFKNLSLEPKVSQNDTSPKVFVGLDGKYKTHAPEPSGHSARMVYEETTRELNTTHQTLEYCGGNPGRLF